MLFISCEEKKKKKKQNQMQKNEYNFKALDSIAKPCDCVDYLADNFNEILRMLDSGNENPYEYEALNNRSTEIQEYCDEKFEWSDKERVNILINCDRLEEMKKITKKINELL